MSGKTLTTGQKNVLFALMSEAAEVSNTDLQDKYGISLHGKEREQLNHWQMVGSRKVGRVYHHELLDTGWAQCGHELAEARAPRGNLQLFAVLTGLSAYCEREKLTLADIFAARVAGGGSEGGSVDDAIRDAYKGLAKRGGSYVGLADLRSQMRIYPTNDVNAALRRLAADGTIALAAKDGRVQKQDREAAVRFAGQDMHLVAMVVS